MEPEKKLQKFTNETSALEILNSTHKLTAESILPLSNEKKQELNYLIKYKLEGLHGEDLEAFMYKVSDLIDEKLKNQTWDRNHFRIKNFVQKYLIDHQKFPTVLEIAETLRLSRLTVGKHLKDFDLLDYSKENYQMMTIMFDELIGKIFAKAMKGDLTAARLITEIMIKGEKASRTTFKVKNQQNNFIITDKSNNKIYPE